MNGGTHNVDQKLQRALPLLDELRSIVFLPLSLVLFTKVAAECLLSPRSIDRVGDWCEGRARLVLARVLEEL